MMPAPTVRRPTVLGGPARLRALLPYVARKPLPAVEGRLAMRRSRGPVLGPWSVKGFRTAVLARRHRSGI